MLLGQKSPADVAAQWASFLTQAEQEARSKQQ
jgi:hypothetical protein